MVRVFTQDELRVLNNNKLLLDSKYASRFFSMKSDIEYEFTEEERIELVHICGKWEAFLVMELDDYINDFDKQREIEVDLTICANLTDKFAGLK